MDPDLLASQKPADLDLHCFQNRIYLGSRVNVLYKSNKLSEADMCCYYPTLYTK